MGDMDAALRSGITRGLLLTFLVIGQGRIGACYIRHQLEAAAWDGFDHLLGAALIADRGAGRVNP